MTPLPFRLPTPRCTEFGPHHTFSSYTSNGRYEVFFCPENCTVVFCMPLFLGIEELRPGFFSIYVLLLRLWFAGSRLVFVSLCFFPCSFYLVAWKGMAPFFLFVADFSFVCVRSPLSAIFINSAVCVRPMTHMLCSPVMLYTLGPCPLGCSGISLSPLCNNVCLRFCSEWVWCLGIFCLFFFLPSPFIPSLLFRIPFSSQIGGF